MNARLKFAMIVFCIPFIVAAHKENSIFVPLNKESKHNLLQKLKHKTGTIQTILCISKRRKKEEKQSNIKQEEIIRLVFENE